MHENLWERLIYEASPLRIWSPNLLTHLTSGARRPNIAVIREGDSGMPRIIVLDRVGVKLDVRQSS